MVFESVLNPIFGPVLQLKPFYAILLISFILTVVTVIAYKYLTNQKKMRDLKKEMKDMQKDIKKYKNDPKKAMEVQKKAMEKNFEFMKHSMKPTLITFLPLIIIFGWLNSNMAYYPLYPNTQFNVTATFQEAAIGKATLEPVPELKFLAQTEFDVSEANPVVWQLKGEAGKYNLNVNLNNKTLKTLNIIISNERKYEQPKVLVKNSLLKQVEVSNKPIHPFGKLSIFGWKPGWLGTYIIFSLVFSTLLRKIMNVV